MLEGRKLSLEMQRNSNGRVWTVLGLLIPTACILLLVSLWIGLAITPPPPDKSQDNMAQAHANVLEQAALFKTRLANDQTITPELFDQMSDWVPVLSQFAQSAAKTIPATANSSDTNLWPGRSNLILEDLNTLVMAKQFVLDLQPTRDSLSALFKPKGPVSLQASATLSAVKEFSMGVAEWRKVSGSPSDTALTWGWVMSTKVPWRQINAQLDALDGEAKQTDNAAQAKAAQTLLNALNQNNLLQKIRNTDDALTKVWAAQERLITSLEQLPPVPKVVTAPPPFSWSQFAFPGKLTDGLMAAMVLVLIGLSVTMASYLSSRQHLKRMSQKWLVLTHQLENAVREVTQPLAKSVIQQEELVDEFNQLLEQSRLLQLTLNTPIETPQKTLEDQAWSSTARIQAELESELTLLREKLLNIHLQFCSGTSHENLVYDLAFTTEGLQTVLITASDLGRSFAILKEHMHQTDATGNDQELVAMMSHISNLKTSVKRMTQQLRDLSHKLQLAVEDVPDGKRFDGVSAPNASRGPHGNPSV